MHNYFRSVQIRHGMNIVRRATEHLNPGQISVIAMDQPLYTIIKCIQWTWRDTYGEDKYVVIMGGLHIEMALWKTL